MLNLYNIWGTYTVVEAGALYMYMYVSVIHEWNKYIVHACTVNG